MASPTGVGVSAITVSPTGTNNIDALLGGTKWGLSIGSGVSLTYSFPWAVSGTSAYWASNYGEGENQHGSGFNATQQSAFASALQSWSRFANLTYSETSDNQFVVGDIRAAFWNASTHAGSSAHAYYPDGYAPEGGDVWIYSSQIPTTTSFSQGSFDYFTLIHEIGHTLGLKHSFEGVAGNSATLSASWDHYHYTVMSYSAYENAPSSGWLSTYPTSPMWFDIQALQYLYGANTTYNNGDTTYSYSENQKVFETLWDAGGVDTIKYESTYTGGTIDLRAGYWSKLGTSLYDENFRTYNDLIIYNGVTIENATGGEAGDTLTGNDVGNVLTGNGGNDLLTGNGGNDTLYGNTGADTLYGNTGSDTLYGGQQGDTLYGGQDNDTLYGNYSDDFLYGNLGDDVLYGGQDNDYLHGGGGNDFLYGNLGTDTLVGGIGNDTLSGGDGADTFSFEASQGVDSITDFSAAAGDKISIASGTNGITTAAQALSHLTTDSSGYAVLDLGSGNSVTLIGVASTSLSASAFVIG